MLSALSREQPSLMDRGAALLCTCPCHPHTLSTIDPFHVSPVLVPVVPHSLGEGGSSCTVSTEICFLLALTSPSCLTTLHHPGNYCLEMMTSTLSCADL